MPQTATKPKKMIRLSKLDLDAELRLIRMLKTEMKKDGEEISAESLRDKGYSASFIKRFLSA